MVFVRVKYLAAILAVLMVTVLLSQAVLADGIVHFSDATPDTAPDATFDIAPVVLDDKRSKITLEGHIRYLEIPSNLRTEDILKSEDKQSTGLDHSKIEDFDHVRNYLHELSKSENWKISKDKVLNEGYTNSTYWIHTKVKRPEALSNNSGQTNNNTPSAPVEWLLEIAYPVLDHIEVFIVGDQRNEYFALGDHYPFDHRVINHRNFALPLRLSEGEIADIYIYVKSSSSIQVPLIIWQEDEFREHYSSDALLHGIFFGSLVIIAIYNALLYTALKENVYLYYVAFVLSMALFTTGIMGYSFQYLWPHSTTWNDQSIAFCLALCVFSATLFAHDFLGTRQLGRTIEGIQVLLIMLAAYCVIGAFILPYAIAIKLIIIVASFAAIYGLVIGLVTPVRGTQAARYYTLSWTLFLLGSIVLALNKFGFVPRNIVTDNAMYIGILLQTVLLSFALAERISSERSLRFAAQRQALESQKKATEALEKAVAERTRDLEIANQRLNQLNNTDALTNIANRRCLDDFLNSLIASRRYKKECYAVMLIDVDHFKSINDEYGHVCGDCCLQVIANNIRNSLREENDFLARYGGEEFCVVIQRSNKDHISIIAERIRQTVADTPHRLNGIDINITVSIGITFIQPDSSFTVPLLLESADQALYKSKTNGRNQITMTDLVDECKEDLGYPLAAVSSGSI